ncbi:unnamed protein product, partial [Ranitomeya imitator]
FFKVATFCFDDCFAHSWHSLNELQEVVTGNSLRTIVKEFPEMLSTCWPFCLHSAVQLTPNHLEWVQSAINAARTAALTDSSEVSFRSQRSWEALILNFVVFAENKDHNTTDKGIKKKVGNSILLKLWKREILCPDGEYRAVNHCCKRCNAGTYAKSDCEQEHGDPTCNNCIEGSTYMNTKNGEHSCRKCTPCDSVLEELSACTVTRNFVCKCKEDFFCTENKTAESDGCNHCQHCTKCEHGYAERCSSIKDAVCNLPSRAYYALIALVPVVILIVVTFASHNCSLSVLADLLGKERSVYQFFPIELYQWKKQFPIVSVQKQALMGGKLDNWTETQFPKRNKTLRNNLTVWWKNIQPHCQFQDKNLPELGVAYLTIGMTGSIMKELYKCFWNKAGSVKQQSQIPAAAGRSHVSGTKENEYSLVFTPMEVESNEYSFPVAAPLHAPH